MSYSTVLQLRPVALCPCACASLVNQHALSADTRSHVQAAMARLPHLEALLSKRKSSDACSIYLYNFYGAAILQVAGEKKMNPGTD